MFQAGFSDISPRVVFLSIVAWLQMLGIMAVMDQKEFLAFLNPGSGTCKARFEGFSPCFVFPLVVGRPAGRSVWTRRTIMQLAGFTGDDAPRAVLPFIVVRPKTLGIMAGMTRGVPKIGLFWEMTSYVSVCGSLVRQLIHVNVSLTVAWSMVQTAENCGNSAVAVLRWSSNFLSETLPCCSSTR